MKHLFSGDEVMGLTLHSLQCGKNHARSDRERLTAQ